MNDDKSFVDQIIMESRLAEQRVDKLFERLEGCEKRLKEISQDLNRLNHQVNLMQSTDYSQRSPANPAYHDLSHGCGDNMIGDHNRAVYEQSMRRERKSQEQSTDGKQEE